MQSAEKITDNGVLGDMYTYMVQGLRGGMLENQMNEKMENMSPGLT